MTGFDFAAALEGFLLGAGLIIAIDVQNAFVLRQGLLRQHVMPVALVCSFADALLIAAGVGGFGRLVQTVPLLLTVFTALGAAFLFFYGAVAFRNALHPGVLQASAADKASLGTVLAACLAFTFLNPHVYLDTLVLIGASSARFPTPSAIAFGIGATLASFIWFFGLAYGARLLTPIFARPAAWRVLDLLIGVIMWTIGAKLAMELWP